MASLIFLMFATFFAVNSDTALGVPEHAFLLITSSSNAIFRMDPVTHNSFRIPFQTRVYNPIAVDYDPVDKRIYWTEVSPFINTVRSAFLNGSDVRTVRNVGLVGALDGLTIDPTYRVLFYTDAERHEIVMVSLNTFHYKVIVRTSLDRPRGIVADPAKGVIYWTQWGNPPKIERANYDGSDRRVLVDSGLSLVNAIVLDARNQKLYWVDAGTDVVESCNTDGTGRRELFGVSSSFFFFDVALVTPIPTLYITDWGPQRAYANQSQVIRLDVGSDDAYVIGQIEARLNGIHAYDPENIYQGPNVCGNNNGGCSIFCIPLLGNSRQCMCPENQVLTDSNTCTYGWP